MPTLTIDNQVSPRIITVDAPDTEISIQELVDELRGWEDSPAQADDPQIISAAGKEPLGGGVFVGVTATLLDAQVAFEARVNPLETGNITTGDASGTTLIDTSATFVTQNVGRGDLVYNTTDGSQATVISVDSETQLTTTPLIGGADNDFDISDAYSVYDVVQCNITGGNLVATDVGGLNIDPAFPTFGTQIVRTSSSSATQLQEEDIQFLSYWNDSVWVDVTKSNTGTTYPVGTTRAPVNNFSDAQLIADARGLYNITIRNNSTVGSSTHDSIKFFGRSPRTSVLTVGAGATLTACEFESLLLTGDLGGNGSSYFTQVALKDVSGIFGHLEGCVLREGTNTLSTPNGFVMLNKCAAVSAVDPGIDIPILDLNGSGRVAARSLDGEIKIINKSSGNNCSLHLDGAVVELDSTIASGHWRFHGVGAVIDNSTGSTTLDVQDLVAPEYITTTVRQQEIQSRVELLWQDRGFDASNPLTVDESAKTISVAGTVRTWAGNIIKTLTRTT